LPPAQLSLQLHNLCLHRLLLLLQHPNVLHQHTDVAPCWTGRPWQVLLAHKLLLLLLLLAQKLLLLAHELLLLLAHKLLLLLEPALMGSLRRRGDV
jgi:hypothetical protein